LEIGKSKIDMRLSTGGLIKYAQNRKVRNKTEMSFGISKTSEKHGEKIAF